MYEIRTRAVRTISDGMTELSIREGTNVNTWQLVMTTYANDDFQSATIQGITLPTYVLRELLKDWVCE